MEVDLKNVKGFFYLQDIAILLKDFCAVSNDI